MDKRIFRGARELSAYTGFSENAIHILVARGVLPVHPETLMRWHRELVRRRWAAFGRR